MFRGRPQQIASPGKSLASLLRRANIAREEIAECLSVSVDTVNKWCRDRAMMRVAHFAELLSFLVERRLDANELQEFISEFLMNSGLSSVAGLKLLPPSRTVHRQESVLLVAPEILTLRGMSFIVAGAKDYLRPMGVEVILASPCDGVHVSSLMVADMIRTTNPLGIILFRDLGSDAARVVLDAAAESKTPIVGLELPTEQQKTVAVNVTVNNFAIGYHAAQYLMNQRYTKLGFVGDSRAGHPVTDRLRGFQQALLDNGLVLHPEALFLRPPSPKEETRPAGIEDTASSWRPVVRKALHSLIEQDITALFCSIDSAALALVSEFNHTTCRTNTSAQPYILAVTTSRWPDITPEPKIGYFLLPSYQMGFEAARLVTLVSSMGDKRLSVRSLELQCEFCVANKN